MDLVQLPTCPLVGHVTEQMLIDIRPITALQPFSAEFIEASCSLRKKFYQFSARIFCLCCDLTITCLLFFVRETFDTQFRFWKVWNF